jgi:sulfotransferase
MQKIFFNSSLPRSGSTLLQNIIAQNPLFYCTPTSGTLELIYGARANYSNDPTFKAQDPDLMERGFRSFCYSGLHGFYSAITEKQLILEKSRGWGIHFNLLRWILQEKPKIVCMVRDIKQIVTSMEIKFRENVDKDTGTVNHAEMRNTTTPKRVDTYLSTQPLGLALERLSEVFRQGLNKDMLFVRYEDLCNSPHRTLNSIYDYFEVERFVHNISNVVQVTKEDDAVYGIYGDHKIRSTVSLKDNNPTSVLGNDICNYINNRFDWYNTLFNYA